MKNSLQPRIPCGSSSSCASEPVLLDAVGEDVPRDLQVASGLGDVPLLELERPLHNSPLQLHEGEAVWGQVKGLLLEREDSSWR